MTIGTLHGYCPLLGLCLCFCFAGSLAFAFGNTLGGVDLDATVPLTTAAFWHFAHSRDFYRRTREQSATVRQEVVDLSNWEQGDGATTLRTDDQPGSTSPPPPLAPPGAGYRRADSVFGGLPPSEDRRLSPPPPPPQQQQQPQQQRQQRLWYRKARLNYAISSPFGSSDATVVQEHTLLELDVEPDLDQQQAGGDGGGKGNGKSICYTQQDCITGFPMVPGDVSVKTTFWVTPATDGDPERVRVRMGVAVEEIELPRRLQFLSKRVGKIIGNGGRKQAEMWLSEMITAASLEATATTAAADARQEWTGT